ncbi:MAG: penicillin acylase family protein [Pseudomonadota bacterium]|nr:penicillin acylase family protein [Pseudomonadota bacterium]
MRSLLVLPLMLVACEEDKAGTPAQAECDLADYPASYMLQAAVEVRRDDRNIPHLYAQSDADLFYGAGYQAATDRLFELDTFVRAAKGTLAEVRGEESWEDDIAARTFDFGRYACDSLAWLAEDTPDDYALMVAYVSGVNARIAEVHAGDVPLPWGFGPAELDYLPDAMEVADIVRIGQRINLGYSSTIEYDILYSLMTRLNANYADMPVFDPAIPRFIAAEAAPTSAARPDPEKGAARKPPFTWSPAEAAAFLHGVQALRAYTYPGEGSNNWAVNAAFTDNGRPLVANDPHSSFHDPNTLYMQHLNSADAGGAFDVAGFSFVGVPGVQLGHNARLAWAATTHFPDQTDLFDVAITDGVADMGGTGVPVSEREEIIRVKLADGTVEERLLVVQDVDGYGVILPEELLPVPENLFANGKVLVSWVGFAPTNELRIYFDLNRASTLNEFEAAIDHQRVGMHNWMGATADGMLYHTHGLIPDRGPAATRPAANQVLDASDASTLWTGEYLSADRLPHLDGTQPFMVTANNDPWGHTADNDPLNDEFYYGSFFSPGFRADRISTELDRVIAAGPATAADMMALQLDTYSTIAAILVPLLEAAASRIDADPELQTFRGRDDLLAAVSRLSAWDRRMVRSSEEAALFRAWQGFASRRTLGSDLSLLYQPVEASSPVTIAKLNLLVQANGIDSVLDGRGDYDLLAGLDDALTWAAERAATESLAAWSWQDMHRVKVHPTWGETQYLPVDGDESTPNVSGCSFWTESGDPAETCDGDEGPIFRSVTGFGEDGVPETSFNVLYANDHDRELWQEGVYDALAFRRTEVEARTIETSSIEP